MDDVALIHEETKQLQEIMDTTNHVALTNHIEFGAAKCKVVKIGPGKKSQITLNEQILEEVTAYEYLGDTINNKADLEDQIKALKGTGNYRRNRKDKSLWREGIKNIQEEHNISDETLTGNKEMLRKIMSYENKSKFEQYVRKEAAQKSKVKHWLEIRGGEIPQRRAAYPKRMTRKQCSNIINVRTRMLPVK